MQPMSVPQAVAVGHEHFRAGRLAEAAGVFRQVLQVAPDEPGALHYLGVIACQQGQPDAGLDLIRRSIALQPDKPAYYNNLGLALARVRRFDEAVACQRQLLALRPDFPDAHGNLGNSFLGLERMAEAEDCFRRELALHPDNATVWSNLGLVLSETGRVSESLDCYRRGVALRPDHAALHSNLLMVAQFDPAATVESLRAEHAAWVARHAAPLARTLLPHANDRTPGRRVRVGYVSPDLRGHVVGWSIEPVLARHDPARFEVYCYSDGAVADDVTRRLRGHAAAWRESGRLDPGQLAEQIRYDRIDVLVDLTLHMGHNRMPTFARKPAPVQVTYLGYAASTGLPTMDYRITDPHLDPPGTPPDGPEELLRLPRCYWAYRPAADAPAVGLPPAARNGFVTFGSFNNFRKVNPGVVAAWADILWAVPDSRLLIVLRGGADNAHVLAWFERQGVAAGRVRLLPRQSVAGYFRLHGEIDVHLDPFPYNGGITNLNALWMGVPFVALAGDRPVARAGVSLLNNVGLPDLIAADVGEYVRKVVGLAQDPARLADLRGSLRDRLRASPLMDEEQFTRDLEALYLRAWERWRTRGGETVGSRE